MIPETHTLYNKPPRRYDFRIDAHDTLVLIYPLTKEAGDWAAAHLPEGMGQFGHAATIDPLTYQAVARDILNAGLTIGSATRIGKETTHA